MQIRYFIVYLFCLIKNVEPGKVLVYSPSISYSHLISNGRIADTLVDAGHDVVMFIPEYDSSTNHFNGTKKAKVSRMNNLNSSFEDSLTMFEGLQFTSPTLSIAERMEFEDTCAVMCEAIMKRHDELEVLRQYSFDVAFSEQIDLCGVGIIRYLGINNHLWISTTAIMEAVSYNLGIPQPSSYVPTIEENDNGDRMSFWERAHNMYMYLAFLRVHRYGTDQITEIIRRHAGPTFPNVREIAANSSLCFVNTDEMFDFARPIIHKTIYIGGLGMREARPLDETFTRIMSSGKEGVILFSLGTLAPFHIIPADVQRDIFKLFKEMSDYHFLVKIAKTDMATGKLAQEMSVTNVDLVTWLPQSDLLGHPRLRLFIMHGGLNGIIEAVHRGVPMIVIPVFADQFRNGRNVERRGIGKVILKENLNKRMLGVAVHEILNDIRYKENARRMSKLVRERPFSPEERLLKWTEFAINNVVLDVLHVEGSRLSTIQYFNLDIIAVFLLLASLIIFIVIKSITFAISLATGSSKQKTA